MQIPFINKLIMMILSLSLLTQASAVAAEPTKTSDTVAYHESWLSVVNLEEREQYTIDRGEACKYLIDAYTKLTGAEPMDISVVQNPFKDVHAGELPYVVQAYHLGLIHSAKDGYFHPTKPVTKGDMAVMFYSLVTKTSSDINLEGMEMIQFPDEVEEYALKPLQFAFSRGVVNKPASGKIEANAEITLGEFISAINKLVFAAPEYPVVSENFLKKYAYLTFDDSTSANTTVILDTLKQYNVKATFFVTGKSDPALLKRMKDEGHVIGNHTMTHNYESIYANTDAFWADFNAERDYILETVGDVSMFLRFPGGSNNSIGMRRGVMGAITAQAKEKGYIYVDWNVDSGDARGGTVPKETIIKNVISGSSNKTEAIILMHQTAPKTTTAQALPEIIVSLRAMGFQLKPLNESSYYPRFVK